MEAEIPEDIHFILGLIAGLCQFEDRDELMLAVLVEQLQAREKMNMGTFLLRERYGVSRGRGR